ncbi:MAG: LPS-assembly protein LptD [Thiobacillaceae bacterium]|nr:LPS-assembly protein LptD [Thiobacillaceae bacterium]
MPPRHVLLAPLILVAALHECLAESGMDLKPSAEFPAWPPPGQAERILLEADRLEGRKDRDLVAEGRVDIRRLDDRIQADWLRYDQSSDEVEARGQVLFTRDRNRVEGSHLKLKLAEHLGGMEGVRYTLHDQQGHPGRGDATAIRFEGRDRYRLQDANYTTCPPEQQDWVLKADDLRLDYTSNLGNARHVQVRYLDTPILYTPWIDFALDASRKSGLLAPSTGVSDQRGFELLMPWYWNIAPNRDATFYPRVMSKRGLQVGTEYRYLEEAYGGELALEYLPDDREAGRDRYRGLLRHNQRFSPRWSGSVSYEDVSDDSYFTDLSSLVRETSRVNLLQEGVLRYDGDWWRAVGRFQRYETLQDPKAYDPDLIPYERVPQILASGTRQGRIGLPWRLDLQGEFVRFEHELSSKSTGNRLDLYPSVSLPINHDVGFITPRFGWRHTQYDLDRNPTGGLGQTRDLPIASLDSGIFLERDTKLLGTDMRQTLEPRAYYVYIPYEDQSGIPVFDTAQRDLTLDQLFSENQYSGIDRVNDANQLTLAITTRLIEAGSGIERLQATLGQRLYFSDQRVTLPGQPVRDKNTTDLLLQLAGQITERTRLTSGVQFDSDRGNLIKGNLGGTYRQGPGRLLNLDYRYTEDLLDQFDLSWQWPLKPKWHSMGRVTYSSRDSRLVEGLLGLEYNAGCWSLRAVAQRLATSETEITNAFFLQLELHGLTALGPNPLEVLKRSISGYTKSNELDLP